MKQRTKIMLTGILLVSLFANTGFVFADTLNWPLTFDGANWVPYEETITWDITAIEPTLTPIGGVPGGDLYFYTKISIGGGAHHAKLTYQPESENAAPFIEFKFLTPEDEVDDDIPGDLPTQINLKFSDVSGDNDLLFKLDANHMQIIGQTINFDPVEEDISLSGMWNPVGQENVLFFGFRTDGKIDVQFNGWIVDTIDEPDFMGSGEDYGNVLSGTAHIQVISDNYGKTIFIPPSPPENPFPTIIETDPDYAVFTSFFQGAGYVYTVRPPTNLVANGPSVDEGDLFSLSGTFNDADGWETWTVKVDWDTTDGVPAEEVPITDFVLNGFDGTGGLGSFDLNHDYGGDGTFSGTVQIIDNEGGESAIVPFTAIVNEVPPQVSIDSAEATSNGDGTYYVEVEATIDASPDSVASIQWYIDGIHNPTYDGVEDPTINFMDNMAHTIQLRVTDSSGTLATDQSTVVSGVASTTLTGPVSAETGVPVTFTGTMQFGSYEIHSVSFDYGDGVVEAGTFTGNNFQGTHTYTVGSPTPYTVSVSVIPWDPVLEEPVSNLGTATHSILISEPVPDPVVITGNTIPTSADEMDKVSFDSSMLTITGGGDSLSYTWTITLGGSTVFTSSSSSFDYTFEEDGDYTITVVVSDGLTSDSVTKSFTVSNIPPQITLGGDISGVYTGNPIDLTAVIVDNGRDLTSVVWDFGDGNTFDGFPGIWADPNSDPYTYTSDTVHTYLEAEIFTLTVTASDGTDTVSADILVTIYPEVKASSITADPPSAPEMGSAEFSCSFTAPPGPTYTVHWLVDSEDDPDDLTYPLVGAQPNTVYRYTHEFGQNEGYEVAFQVTSANGGDFIEILYEVYNVAPTVIIDAVPDAVEGSTITFSAVVSDIGGDPFTYAWDFGDGSPISNEVSPTHTYDNNLPGNAPYIVSLTADDTPETGPDDGTTESIEVNILNVAPDVTLDAFPEIVSPGFHTFTGSFVDNPYDYPFTAIWTVDGVPQPEQTISSGTTILYTHEFTVGGTHTVDVRLEDDVDFDTDSLSFIVNSPPVVDSVTWVPEYPLPGELVSFTIDASDPDGNTFDVNWDFGDGNTGTGLEVTNTYATSGTYTVTVTLIDEHGASVVQTFSIVVNDAPVIVSVTPDPVIGRPGEDTVFDLDANDPEGVVLIYAWDFGDGTTSDVEDPSKAYVTSGSYTVTIVVTDIRGATAEYSFDYTVNALPVIVSVTYAPEYPLPGEEVLFELDANDPDGDPLTYAWDFGDGTTSDVEDPSKTYTLAGTYTVTITVTDSNGESVTYSFDITVNDPPVIISVTPDAPIGRPGVETLFDLEANDPEGGDLTYAWDFGDGTTSDVEDPSKAYTTSGTYTVSVLVTDVNGATAEYAFDYVVNALPEVISVSHDPLIPEPNELVTFTIEAIDPDGGDVSITWDFGDGSPVKTGPEVTHAYPNAGTYDIIITITDENGESITYLYQITVNASPIIVSVTPDPAIGRPGEPVTFDLEASDPDGVDLTYAWDFGDGETDTVEDPVHTYVTSETYTVSVEVTDEHGATAVYSFEYTVNALPVIVSVEYEPLEPEPGTEIQFTLDAHDPDGGTLTYSWDFGDGTTSDQQNPSKTYAEAGTYTVTVTVTDENGESVEETLTVVVQSSIVYPRFLKLEAIEMLEEAKEIYGDYGKGTGHSKKSKSKCYSYGDVEYALNRIIKYIDKSLNDKYWEDELHLHPKYGYKVFTYERVAAAKAKAYARYWSNDPELAGLVETLYDVIDNLEEADRILAYVALEEARQAEIPDTNYGHRYWNYLERAEYWYNKGVQYQENNRPINAINAFKKSWRYSQKVLNKWHHPWWGHRGWVRWEDWDGWKDSCGYNWDWDDYDDWDDWCNYRGWRRHWNDDDDD